MPIQQAKKVDHCRDRFGLSTFVARECVFAAPGKLRSFPLGEFELLANARKLCRLMRIDLIAKRQPREFLLRVRFNKAVTAVVAKRAARGGCKNLAFVILRNGFYAVVQSPFAAQWARLAVPLAGYLVRCVLIGLSHTPTTGSMLSNRINLGLLW